MKKICSKARYPHQLLTMICKPGIFIKWCKNRREKACDKIAIAQNI